MKKIILSLLSLCCLTLSAVSVNATNASPRAASYPCGECGGMAIESLESITEISRKSKDCVHYSHGKDYTVVRRYRYAIRCNCGSYEYYTVDNTSYECEGY